MTQQLPPLEPTTSVRRSVQEFPPDDSRPITHIFQFASVADEAPAWWSPARDIYLDKFWPTEPFLAGAIFSIASRNSSFRYELAGPRDQVIWAQQLLAQADFGKGWQSFMMKITQDYLCLGGRSTVMLGGERRGRRRYIRDIVRDRDPGPVLTIDKDGHLVERPIVGWHKTPLGDRRWVRLSLEHGSLQKRKGGLWLTHDHRVLTVNGWVKAQDLRVGDKVVSGHPELSYDQNCLFAGMMLGDACMQRRLKASSILIKLNHSLEWLELKVKALSGLGWTPIYNAKGGKGHRFVGCNSHYSASLSHLYDAWYPDGEKRVARQIVEDHFSPLMLAAWYMDDGTLQHPAGKLCREVINLHTNGFGKEDVEWLAALLTEHGFKADVWPMRAKGQPTYWYIHLGVDAAEKFLEVIAPYVLPCLRYKLPDYVSDFDESLWEDIEPVNAFIDTVEAVEEKPGPTSIQRTTYCIDVEGTHNFAVSGVIVHNCQDNAAMFEIIRPSRARTKAGTWYDAIRMPHPETDEMIWWAYDRHNGTVGSQYELDFKVTDNPLDLPIGIAHLDSQHAIRTGNPEYPIIYTDLSGKDHKLSMYQVVTLEEMPSPRKNMNNVQVCAVSRSLRLAQTLRDMLIYKQEKVSGRFARAIHLTNADADAIEDAVKQANANADNRNLMRYSQPIIAAVLDPNAKPVVETIELASLPDGFDEETAMRWYIAGLALDLGVDYGFLAPLPGNRLGTSTQAEAAERQAKGKSSRLFLNKLEHVFNFSGILPRNVTIKFAVPDPYEESERDRALARRARSISTLIQAGVITPEIARQMLLDWHDLSPDYLALLGEEDLTPTMTLSGSEVPSQSYSAMQ